MRQRESRSGGRGEGRGQKNLIEGVDRTRHVDARMRVDYCRDTRYTRGTRVQFPSRMYVTLYKFRDNVP